MNKFIFLDRDGVINKDPVACNTGKEYISEWEDFHFLPGALEAIRDLTQNGYSIGIISNQAGVAKGVYTKERLDEITAGMIKEIEKYGGKIYSMQYCIHRNEDNCDCRKPKPGLFKMAAEGLDIDFSNTYFIGDTKRDIQAGKEAGCRTILVLSGKIKNEGEIASWELKPDFIKKDLKEAVRFVIHEDEK